MVTIHFKLKCNAIKHLQGKQSNGNYFHLNEFQGNQLLTVFFAIKHTLAIPHQSFTRDYFKMLLVITSQV